MRYSAFLVVLLGICPTDSSVGAPPTSRNTHREEPIILTPKPSHSPRINGAKIFGVRPGSPFLFTIPATGDRPLCFAAENLPTGLRVNENNGQITGSLAMRGEFMVTLKASNALGSSARPLRVV